jgi:hypothetical protein
VGAKVSAKPFFGRAFGFNRDKTMLRLTCLDCDGGEVLLPLDIAQDDFHAEQRRFSDSHLSCRDGQEEEWRTLH